MKGLIRILVLVVLTSFVLALFTEYRPDTLDAKTEVLGLPVVSVHQVGAYGWLSIGQAGAGVLVIEQGGAGVVAIVQAGAGVLFGIGQVMFSSVTIGQGGVGLFGFLGQVGVGAQAAGQGVWKRRSREHFQELGDELNELLAWRSPRT